MVTEFEQVIEEIRTESRNHEQFKKEKITQAAEILVKNKWDPKKVSAKLTQELKGYITGSYITQVLEGEFKRKYEKLEEQKETPKQVMNADGTLAAEAETTGGEENENPKLTKGQLLRQEYEKNKYNPSNKAIKEIKSSKGRSLPDQELEEEPEQEEEQQQEAKFTEVILTSVRFKQVEQFLNQDRDIHLVINPQTLKVIRVYINTE